MRKVKTIKLLMNWFVFTLLLLSLIPAHADGSEQAVYKQQVDKPVSEVYDKLYKSLEDARFFVVF